VSGKLLEERIGKMVNEFKKEKDILKGVEKAEQDAKKEKKCDYKDKREVRLARKEDRDSERKKLLDSIVSGRVCPKCRNRIWSDRSWVIEGRIAICRSCFYSKEGIVDDGKVRGGFINRVLIRVEVNGWKVMQLRVKAGVGIKAFADRMGYSKAYQYQVENQGFRSMTLERVEKMMKVFEEIGVEIIDSI
jgi:hypothetical protein